MTMASNGILLINFMRYFLYPLIVLLFDIFFFSFLTIIIIIVYIQTKRKTKKKKLIENPCISILCVSYTIIIICIRLFCSHYTINDFLRIILHST